MSVNIRGQADEILEQFSQRLAVYEGEHPHADIVLYRQNSASIRIRIVDPDFKGKDRVARNDLVWTYFEGLDERVLFHLTILLLLTPEEAAESFANRDFEHPIRSYL
jgi:stress-induced morphogen